MHACSSAHTHVCMQRNTHKSACHMNTKNYEYTEVKSDYEPAELLHTNSLVVWKTCALQCLTCACDAGYNACVWYDVYCACVLASLNDGCVYFKIECTCVIHKWSACGIMDTAHVRFNMSSTCVILCVMYMRDTICDVRVCFNVCCTCAIQCMMRVCDTMYMIQCICVIECIMRMCDWKYDVRVHFNA